MGSLKPEWPLPSGQQIPRKVVAPYPRKTPEDTLHASKQGRPYTHRHQVPRGIEDIRSKQQWLSTSKRILPLQLSCQLHHPPTPLCPPDYMRTGNQRTFWRKWWALITLFLSPLYTYYYLPGGLQEDELQKELWEPASQIQKAYYSPLFLSAGPRECTDRWYPFFHTFIQPTLCMKSGTFLVT